MLPTLSVRSCRMYAFPRNDPVPRINSRSGGSSLHRQISRAVPPRRQIFPICAVSADPASTTETVWFQKRISVPPMPRGCHVISRQLLSGLGDIKDIRIGLVNFFILHTSASLTINENASPDVPVDLNAALNRIAPEGNFYLHDDEGPDDMPAHVKSSLMGPSLTVPIVDGRLGLGMWQGIYLNEHRNYGGSRNIIATIHGEKKSK